MIELEQLRWFRAHLRKGEDRYTKMAWRARTEVKRPKGRSQQTWKEEIQKILKERQIEWKRIRTIARDRERWKALCKPSTLPVEEVKFKFQQRQLWSSTRNSYNRLKFLFIPRFTTAIIRVHLHNFFFLWRLQPNRGLWPPHSWGFSRSHTTTHHSR